MVPPAAGSTRLATPALTWSTLVLCTLATTGIIVQQELHLPLHIPGYRGLIWMTLLVAVRLVAGRAGPAVVAGVTGGAVSAFLGWSPHGILGALPYVIAAAALDATAFVPLVRTARWIVAALTAPIYLVAMIPVSPLVSVGNPAQQGFTSTVLAFLCLGAAAGLLGLVLSAAWRLGPPPYISGDPRSNR